MGTRSVRARPPTIVALLALASALAACGVRSESIEMPGTLLRITVPAGATEKLISGLRSVEGVVQVAGVSLVDVTARAGAKTAPLKLAVADPDEMSAIASTLLADAVALSSSMGDGRLLLPAAQRERLGIAPGAVLTVRDAGHAPHRLRVDELGVELAGTTADGILARSSAPWLPAGRPTLLLIGVAPTYDANRAAAALAARIGGGVSVAARVPAFLAGRAASRLFGSFSYIVNGDGTIRQDPAWVRRNIVWARVPILGGVRCHRLMIPQLARALGEIRSAGLARLIDPKGFGGCYVARQILWDPTRAPSMHAWGLAIDINVSRNQYGAEPTMDPRLVAIFERWGFAWGGRWKIPDGMHFELAAILRR